MSELDKDNPSQWAELIASLLEKAKPNPGVKADELNTATQFREKLNTARLDLLQQYIKLKKQWSAHLLVALWITLGFQVAFAIVVLVMDYSGHKPNSTYAVVVSTGTFAQIFGMCWLVVNHLFPSKEQEEDLKKSAGLAPLKPDKKEEQEAGD